MGETIGSGGADTDLAPRLQVPRTPASGWSTSGDTGVTRHLLYGDPVRCRGVLRRAVLQGVCPTPRNARGRGERPAHGRPEVHS